VVQFYNRGGNFWRENMADLDADIQPLGLTQAEQDALVAFMHALTDDRVRRHAAPFDHPELVVPNGQQGDTKQVANDGTGRAVDLSLKLAPFGKGGYASTAIPASFDQNLKPVQGDAAVHLRLVAGHSGACLDVFGGSGQDGAALIQWGCHGGMNQQFEQVPAVGGFTLRSRHTGKCLDVSGGSLQPGAAVVQWTCHGGPNQVFNWRNGSLVALHSNQCLDVFGASTASGSALIQWACHGGANQRFRFQ
jgi:hypothetical protein